MIDTIILLIPKEELSYNEELIRWELHSKTKQYEKVIRNPSKEEKNTNKYFPKITGYIRKYPSFSKKVRITKNIYDNKHQEYQDRLQRLNIELEEYTNADYEYQTTVTTVVSVARRAKTIFENSSDVAGKRQFLNYLLQNPTVKDKKLCFTIASPFDSVLELADSSTWLWD